jgi:hypothetical protein
MQIKHEDFKRPLIEAGKQFDMLIMPSVHHNSEWDPYSRGVQQNYLLKHLIHANLPDEPNVVPVGGYERQ